MAKSFFSAFVSMIFLFFLGLAICPCRTFAQIHFQQLNPSVDLSKLKQKGVETHTLENLNIKKGHLLFDIKTRDKWLSDSGINDEIKNFDELGKDLLVKRAIEFPIKKLKKSYPTFLARKLELLKKKVQE